MSIKCDYIYTRNTLYTVGQIVLPAFITKVDHRQLQRYNQKAK